jgi:hypothetical protein
MVFLALKPSTTEEWCKEQNCFGEETTGMGITNRITALGLIPCEVHGIRDNFLL